MNYEQRLIAGITEALVAQGELAANEVVGLEEAFRATNVERFEEFLLDENIVSKQALLQAVQQYYQLTAIDVTGLLLEHSLVTKFPKELMLNYGFVPYQQDGDLLQVIAARPFDEELPDVIGTIVTYDVVFLVGIYRDIADAVKEFYDEAVTIVHEDDSNLGEEPRDRLNEELIGDSEDIVDEE